MQILSRDLFTASIMTSVLALSACSNPTDFRSDGTAVEQNNGTSDDAPGVEKIFDAQFLVEDKISVNGSLNRIEKEFKLQKEFSSEIANFSQTIREPKSKIFNQGTNGRPVSDDYVQTESMGLLDILIVIDDSGSMRDEQTKLKDLLPSLLTYINNADWRIAVVTTTVTQPCNRGIINRGDDNKAALFAAAINAGISGSGNEQGIGRAIAGLSCGGAETPWLRPNSSIAVLIVSDEYNCGDEANACSQLTASYLLNHLKDVLGRPLITKSRVYGLVKPLVYSPIWANTKNGAYVEAIALTGGTFADIAKQTEEQYGVALSAISQNITAILEPQFRMSSTPDSPAAVEVYVNGAKQDNTNDQTFTVQGTTAGGYVVTYREGREPPVGSNVSIRYITGAKPKYKEFELESVPELERLQVSINNQLVTPSSTSFRVEGSKLIFADFPEDNAVIKADFRLKTPYKKEFSIPAAARNVGVKVNDIETQAFQYDANDGKIIFNDFPAEGASIKIAHDRYVGPILNYSMPLLGDAADLQLHDKSTGDAVPFNYNAGQLQIAGSEFSEGRALVLSYLNENSHKKEVMLPFAPNMKNISISGAPSACTLGAGITVVGNLLTIDCEIAATESFDVTISEKRTIKEFTISSVAHPDSGKWQVWVDDVELKQFKRDGRTIFLKLNKNAKKVRIAFLPNA